MFNWEKRSLFHALLMGRTAESFPSKEPEFQELTQAEIERISETLSFDIIRETAKLSRTLDIYDAPLLSRLIKDRISRLVTNRKDP